MNPPDSLNSPDDDFPDVSPVEFDVAVTVSQDTKGGAASRFLCPELEQLE